MDGVICPSGKRWRALIGTCRPQPADPRYSPILRSARKVAPDGLLPNMGVNILGNLLLFLHRKRPRPNRQLAASHSTQVGLYESVHRTTTAQPGRQPNGKPILHRRT